MKPNQKNRSRAYSRHQRNRVIQRKKKIAKFAEWRYPSDGYFAKGKVHCSCGLCSRKTREIGFSHSDTIQLHSLNSQLRDYFIKMNY